MGLFIRLFRIALYGFITWLALVALWLGLPSPSREYSAQPNRYALDTLSAGHSLVRVYNTISYDRNGFPVDFTLSESRQSFALSYRLEQQYNTTLLYLQDGLTIDLAPSYITSYPFTSQEKYTLVDIGDQDGINPPWFSVADSTLLFWWIHRDKGKVALQVYWQDAYTVELRPVQTTLHDDPEGGAFLRLNFWERPGDFQNRYLKDVHVPSGSSSPSATYALRVGILMVIAPTGLLVLGLVSLLRPIVDFVWGVAVFFLYTLLLCSAVLLVLWVVRGMRPIAEDDFMSRLPGMEFLGGRGATLNRHSGRKTVWGPSGPVEVEYEEDERLPRRPIRNPVDFFRSSAPLDDLLATFDVTRRFTEPLGGRYRPQGRRDTSTQRTASVDENGRHRRTYSEDELEENGLIDLEKALPEKPRTVLHR